MDFYHILAPISRKRLSKKEKPRTHVGIRDRGLNLQVLVASERLAHLRTGAPVTTPLGVVDFAMLSGGGGAANTGWKVAAATRAIRVATAAYFCSGMRGFLVFPLVTSSGRFPIR